MIGEITKSPLKAMELLESFKSPNNWTTTSNALKHLYDFIHGVTNEEEEVLLAIKLDLFTIGIVSLLETEMVFVEINFLELNFEELNFDFLHLLGDILVDDTLACLKVKDFKIS
jgi:hypothetical protein